MIPCPCCERAVAPHVDDTGRIFQRCAGCGHVWSMDAAPSSAYYQGLVGRNASDEATLVAKMSGRIASLLPLMRAGMCILEVGCAEGRLGQRIKQEYTVQYIGIEPSRDAERARDVLDSVYTSRAELAAAHPDLRFDLILSFHVLEHIPDVDVELGAWRGLCAPHAQLLVEVPHEAGHPLLSLDRNAEHLHQFTTASLTTLLLRNGFTTMACSSGHFESAVYSDSLRLWARPSLSPDERDAALLARLENLFPNGFAVYGVGGDFHNYLLPLLPRLAPGLLRALHDSNAARMGERLQSLPGLAITPFERSTLPLLITSCRFTASIREQLTRAGTPSDQLFDLSNLLAPYVPATA